MTNTNVPQTVQKCYANPLADPAYVARLFADALKVAKAERKARR